MKDYKKVEILYKLYEQPFYRIAYAILKNEWQAEDAVSDAFEKLILHIDQIGNPQSEQTKKYAVSVMKSVAIDAYRKNMKEQQRIVEFDETFSSTEVGDTKVENEYITVGSMINQRIDIEDGIGMRLPEHIQEQLDNHFSEEEKNLFILRFVMEKTYREIAADLGLNEPTIRKRIERLRKKVKEVCYEHN